MATIYYHRMFQASPLETLNQQIQATRFTLKDLKQKMARAKNAIYRNQNTINELTKREYNNETLSQEEKEILSASIQANTAINNALELNKIPQKLDESIDKLKHLLDAKASLKFDKLLAEEGFDKTASAIASAAA